MMTDDSSGWLREILHFSSDRSLTVLLYALLLLLFVVSPFLSGTTLGRFAIDAFYVLILISGALAAPRFRRIALGTVLVVLVARVFVYVEPTRNFILVSTLLTVLFLTFACAGILRRVFAAGRITRSRIEGAVAVYLLLGLILGLVYTMMAIVNPDALAFGSLDWSADVRTVQQQLFRKMSYFSFITLTTVGYGDITPVSETARQVAVFEGLLGQLYPAILLARLVSMEIAPGTPTDDEDL
jgi:DNA helicase HerA-like ATPase